MIRAINFVSSLKNFFKEEEIPVFHLHDIYDNGSEESQRTCKYASEFSDAPVSDKIGSMDKIPFTMFQYKDGQQSGIMGITAEGLNFDIFDGKLNMSQVCDSIVVYDLGGKAVAEVHNASVLSIGSLHGVYVVSVKAGDKTINTKVNF